MVSTFVSLDEFFKVERHVAELQIAPAAQFVGDIARDILGPFFGGVEADNPDGVLVLALEHVHDDGFEVGALDVGLAKGAAAATKIINHDVDILSSSAGTIEGVQLGLRITNSNARAPIKPG